MRLVSIILLIAGGDVANAPAPCGALTLDVGTNQSWVGWYIGSAYCAPNKGT